MKILPTLALAILVFLPNPVCGLAADRPNILFIMSDDHAAGAISAYGSRVNQTPNFDRLASAGMRFENCFCVNSICTPEPGDDSHGKIQPP